MIGHFVIERGFNDGLGQLLEKSVLSNQVGWLFVGGNDMIQQRLRDRVVIRLGLLRFFTFLSVMLARVVEMEPNKFQPTQNSLQPREIIDADPFN